jgi:hypothetical protein
VWKRIGPNSIDELVRRDGVVDVDKKRDEDASLAGMSDLETAPVQRSLDVSE